MAAANVAIGEAVCSLPRSRRAVTGSWRVAFRVVPEALVRMRNVVSAWSAPTPERCHHANYPHVFPQVSALSTPPGRTPKAGVATSSLPMRMGCVQRSETRSTPCPRRSPGSIGSLVVSNSPHDVVGTSRARTDVSARPVAAFRHAAWPASGRGGRAARVGARPGRRFEHFDVGRAPRGPVPGGCGRRGDHNHRGRVSR
jgi:hypothetical protein